MWKASARKFRKRSSHHSSNLGKMTYSHNRIAANRNNAERYAHGSSPPNSFFGHGGGMHSSRKSNQNRGAWQRSHAHNANTVSTSRCVGNGNPMLSPQSVSSTISSPAANVMNRSGGGRHSGNKSNNQRTNSVQALNGGGPATGLFGRVSPISTLPTITHFAGSKCFDAPAPTALPKPPQHWTATGGGGCPIPMATEPSGLRSQVPSQTSQIYSVIKSARRALTDDFGTHNLKLLLNVQS